MLSLKNIVKDYSTGGSSVRALNGISLEFRQSEFVSILGPSGCGKTTLLNIIGGLDQYTSGDLVINGVSTKKYTDADWDTYRNHSIGFVFQNYNLIPHQTVLANVELALTLSGVSKAERRRRATDALRMVGLASQIHKKPTQMSGGQMQRVAIARALVNDPDILLADEPTGALDTKTSVQIMDILRQISRTKLVIMVTHNPDLARRYSSRIIRLLDGRLVNDSNPYRPEVETKERFAPTPLTALPRRRAARSNPFSVKEQDLLHANLRRTSATTEKTPKKRGKRSMSFFTALSLSFNNLLTKKGRTFMTSFAGSIGIIGIALILSVSTGVNNYINSVQRDTLASYPIQLEAETEDFSSLITTLMGNNKDNENPHALDKVYESAIIAELFNSFNSIESNTNDLTSFKAHLESNAAFKPHLSAVQYSYNFNWSIFTKDEDGTVVESDVMKLFESLAGMNGMSSMGSASSAMMTSGFDVWQEMLMGTEGELINPLIKDQYDLIHGTWPQKYNEVLLVVDKNNEISDLSLYALGLRSEKEIREDLKNSMSGGLLDVAEPDSWTYEEICSMTFRLLLASECYQAQANGTYADMTTSKAGMEFLYNNQKIGTDLRVVGIIRPNEEASSAILTGTIAYTAALSDYALQKTQSSELLKAQLANPSVDALTGLPFATAEDREPTAAEIREAVTAFMAGLTTEKKAEIYTTLLSTPTAEQTATFVEQQMSMMTPENIRDMLIMAFSTQIDISMEELASYVDNMDAATQEAYVKEILAAGFAEQFSAQVKAGLAGLTAEQIAAMYDLAAPTLTEENYQFLYENFLPKRISDSTYDDNLLALGYVREESPASIYLYASSFENKDAISALIEKYNDSVEEEKKISYTDYVALLMSSITTIVNAISYVLIAFVAISLIVSSIMIGIITYISVLERTKEIGILRAIGASKRDIRRVFNAETLLIGFVSGALGIAVTLGGNLLINKILLYFTGIPNLRATLPVAGAVVLVIISMMLTLIAGLFPSGVAAKKNPVEALRSE